MFRTNCVPFTIQKWLRDSARTCSTPDPWPSASTTTSVVTWWFFGRRMECLVYHREDHRQSASVYPFDVSHHHLASFPLSGKVLSKRSSLPFSHVTEGFRPLYQLYLWRELSASGLGNDLDQCFNQRRSWSTPLVLFVFHNLRSVQYSLWRDVLLARPTPSKRRSLLDCWQKGLLLASLLNSVFLVCAATARDLPFFEIRQFGWQQMAWTRGFDCGPSAKHPLSRCLLRIIIMPVLHMACRQQTPLIWPLWKERWKFILMCSV